MLEELLHDGVNVVVAIVEAASVVVIAAGAAVAFVLFVRALVRRDIRSFVRVRLLLGRFLALGLEFQLAGDIVRTAVAPSFEEIGKLAAIAAIRTGLNYFLAREIAEERRQVEQEESGEPPAEEPTGHRA